jgi:hypothetical protein
MNNPFQCLLEVKKILKNSGKCLMTVPNLLIFGYFCKCLLNHDLNDTADHVFGWRVPEIKVLLNRAGFQILKTAFVETHWHRKKMLAKVRPSLFCDSLAVLFKKL